jgi:hypothetical protein
VVKVALDCTHEHTRVITKSVGCVLECAAQERLAHIQQVEADVGSVALLKDLLDEADFALSVARAERN